MSLTKRVGLLAGTAALSVTSVSLAGTGAEADKTTEARLAAAEAKIAQLTSANQDNWLTEQRADEIRGVVQDVLADADTRSSLLTQGVTAGYDNGAVLGSSDGNWLLRTNILMQQRFTYNQADRATGGSIDENRWGFDNPRTKFTFSGHVGSPDWTYRIDVNEGSNEDGFREGVGNAYLGYNYGNGWKVKMGTMKAPLLREELVESQHQLAMERSVTNYTFTGGYTDGIAIEHESDTMHFAFALTDGADEGNTNWTDYDTEYAITARVEFLLSGNWSQFEDFTSPQGSEAGFMVGIANHYQTDEYGDSSGPELTTHIFTVDASYEDDGWNAYGAFIYADFDDDTTGGVDFNPMAFLVQGGYYLNENTELYVRYETADFDTTGVEDLGIFTIGMNKYLIGHNVKWTTELLYGIDELDSSALADEHVEIGGLRLDESGEDSQMALRTQIQILF